MMSWPLRASQREHHTYITAPRGKWLQTEVDMGVCMFVCVNLLTFIFPKGVSLLASDVGMKVGVASEPLAMRIELKEKV